MAATTLLSGINTFFPTSFARDRYGNLIWVNGIDRGRIWDGQESTPWLLGTDAPDDPPTATTGSGGGSAKGTYYVGFRYRTEDGRYSSLSGLTSIYAATSGTKFNYANLDGSSNTRVENRQVFRSTVNQQRVLYHVTSTQNTTFSDDLFTDDQLFLREALPIQNANGSLNARRFGVPPTTKPFLAMFQDRAFYYGNVQYSKGTISLGGGSQNVSGSGVSWNTGTFAGRFLYPVGHNRGYEINSVLTTSTLTLVEAYAGTTASGVSYVIRSAPSETRQGYFSEADEPESVPATNTFVIQENTADDDLETGLLPAGSELYALHERSIYRMNFFRQPTIDLSITLAAKRGCVNNRSWLYVEGVAYLMDFQGVYRFAGNDPEPLSEAISDLWRDGTIDWDKKKWFFASHSTEEQVLRWHVALVGDSGDRPMRAVAYHYPSGTWSKELYQWELGGATYATIDGLNRTVVGGEDDTVYLVHEGTTDGVTGAWRGTATTASSSTTLTDSAASFTAAVVGAPVAILDGTGKDQIRRIASRTTTQLTVSTAWTTNPPNGSTYLIGAIPITARTGRFSFNQRGRGVRDDCSQRRNVRMIYEPTASTAQLDVRMVYNHDTAARVNRVDYDYGNGVECSDGSADNVIDMTRERSALADAQGFAQIPHTGMLEDASQGDRYLQLEVKHFQGDDRLRIHRIEIEGVVG